MMVVNVAWTLTLLDGIVVIEVKAEFDVPGRVPPFEIGIVDMDEDGGSGVGVVPVPDGEGDGLADAGDVGPR
jgi:hypothetical protein